jgi:hypothetical protein
LDFIKDQDNILLIAKLPYTLDKLAGGRIQTALALNRLQNNSTGIFPYQLPDTVQVVKFSKCNSAD